MDEQIIKITIPEGVKNMDTNCLNFYNIFQFHVIIPKSITSIPKKCFIDCNTLINITLPLNDSQIICGNKIFSVPHFKQLFYLPNSIKIINGKEVNRSKMIIPYTVTSLD